jgi:hypothetical protein
VQARSEGLDRREVGARAEAHAAGAREHEDAGAAVGLELGVAVGEALGGRPSIAVRRSGRSTVRTAAAPTRS